MQDGILRARGGDLTTAWRVLGRVAPDDLAEPDRVRLLINRATIASQLQHLDAAAADLAAANELARQLELLPLAFVAGHNLGWVQFLRGDLPAALAATDSADELRVDVDTSVARLDRARILLEAGLAGEAIDALEGIGKRGSQLAAEADLERARAELVLGRAADAIRDARRAARRFASRGEPFWERRCRLVALIAKPGLPAARRLWDEASVARDVWVAQHAAAILASRIDGVPPPGIMRSIKALAASPVTSRRIAGLVALARLSATAGDLGTARRRLRAASTELLRAQLGVVSLDLRAAVAVHGEAALELELALADPIPGRAGVDAQVEAAERWRAATRPMPRVLPDGDPAIAAAAARLRQAKADLVADPGAVRAVERVERAERELRAASWAIRSEVPLVAQPWPAARLRAAARQAGATVAVCLSRGARASALVLTGRSARRVDLGDEAKLSALVAAAYGDLAVGAALPESHPMRAVVRASLQARIAELRAALIEPLGPLGRELVVVPSRGLAGVPWTALVDGPVTVTPTASGWASGARAVAEPLVGALAGPQLEGAAAEVDEVLGLWKRPHRPGTLAAALATCDVVHVAAHGTHRGDNPLFSSLLLPEGVVVAHELENVPVRASHVVLSACEVGRAAHRPGDQPLGLTAALLAAGVACVVAPIAPVADRLAGLVMGRYHRGLVAGLDAATALAEATAGTPAAGAYVCHGSAWRGCITGGPGRS